MKGPFRIEQEQIDSILTDKSISSGPWGIYLPEFEGSAYMISCSQTKEEATELCDRLNAAVSWWEQKQEQLL